MTVQTTNVRQQSPIKLIQTVFLLKPQQEFSSDMMFSHSMSAVALTTLIVSPPWSWTDQQLLAAHLPAAYTQYIM